MSKNVFIATQILHAIAKVAELPPSAITGDTKLIGDGSILDSMKLVELCLQLEDLAGTLNFEFDWTSETAMSRSRGMFRTAESLIEQFIAQMEMIK